MVQLQMKREGVGEQTRQGVRCRTAGCRVTLCPLWPCTASELLSHVPFCSCCSAYTEQVDGWGYKVESWSPKHPTYFLQGPKGALKGAISKSRR